MTISGVAEMTLQARDLAALERFYADAFGLPVLQRDDDRLGSGVAARRP
jgi:catechol-2,3-dioxygenase